MRDALLLIGNVCDPSLGAGACGGNGQCDPTTLQCQCNALWSSESDFISSTADCPTSLVAVYVLWTLNLVEIAWVLYSTVYVVAARFEVFWQTRKKTPSATLWKNKGLFGVLFFAAVCIPSQVIMSIYRLANPTSPIGFEVAPTVLFLTAKAGLYGTSMVVQGPLIAAVLKGNADTKRLVKFNYASNCIISLASILVGAFPFITLGAFQHDIAKQVDVMRAYYFVQAACLVVNGVQALLIKRAIFRALDRASAVLSSSNNKTEGIKHKISEFQDAIVKQGLAQCLIYCIMGAVPLLINKHAYFLPISWLAMPILWKRLAFQFDLDRGNTKTIRARLGLQKADNTGSAKSSGPNHDHHHHHHNNNNNVVNGSNKKLVAFTSSAMKMASPKAGGGAGTGSSFGEMYPPVSLVLEPFVPLEQQQRAAVDVTAATPSRSMSRKGRSSNHHRNADSNGSVLTKKTFLEGDAGVVELLEDGTHQLRGKFADFLKQRRAHEFLALYDACIEYETASTAVLLNKLGHKIVLNFVLDNGAQSVDMEFSLRKQVLEVDQKRAFKPDSLADIKSMTLAMMQSNFYAPFLRKMEDDDEDDDEEDE